MHINKFIKSKNGMYIILLDNNVKVKIHEDLILKYNLLITKTLDEDTLEKTRVENMTYEIYEVALKYINVKLRSKEELSKYLLKKGYSSALINDVIIKLASQGYMSDKIYVTSFIHDKLFMSNYGPNKIISELTSLGIDENLILDNMNVYTSDIELDRANKIVSKMIKSNHNKGSMVLKNKIYNQLINLGYNTDIISKALNGKKLVDEDIYKKEYDKLYKQLSKKYSGSELEYKLKQKLYQKGFNNFE